MTDEEVGLIKWLIKRFCPKPPKPQPTIEFEVGPTMKKEFYHGSDSHA